MRHVVPLRQPLELRRHLQTQPIRDMGRRRSGVTWCTVPSISTGMMKSALFTGWSKETDRETLVIKTSSVSVKTTALPFGE